MSGEIRKIIDEVDATMRLEGMPLTADDMEMLRRCLDGESSFDVERERIFKEIALLNG
ncbi:hypothetical protein [Thomasclavelia sp.]